MAARNTKRPKKSAANNDAQTIPLPQHGAETDSQQPATSGTHQAVNCSICWEELPTVDQPRRSRKWVARPEGCDHHFCYTCLKRWTRTKTSCPVCRTRFARIAVMRTVSGEVMRTDEFSNAETSSSEDSDMPYFIDDDDFGMGDTARSLFMRFLPMQSFSSWFFRTRGGTVDAVDTDSDSDDTDWSTSRAHHRPDSDSEIESDSATDSFLMSASDSFPSGTDSDSSNTTSSSSEDSESDSGNQRAGCMNCRRNNRNRNTNSALRRNATQSRSRNHSENRHRSRQTPRGLESALHAFAQDRADAAAANAHATQQPTRQRQPRSFFEREQRRQQSLNALLAERVRRSTSDLSLPPTASNSATSTSSNALPDAPVSSATTSTDASAAANSSGHGGHIELVNVTLNVPLGQTTSHGTQRGTSTFTLPGGRGSAEMRVDLRFEPRPGGVLVLLSGNAFVPDVHSNVDNNARPRANRRRARNRAASNASVSLNTIPIPVPVPLPIPTTSSSSATTSTAAHRRAQRTLPNHQHAARKSRSNMQEADATADRSRSPMIRERFELANRFRRARARVTSNEPNSEPTEAASTSNTAPHRA